MPLVTQEKLKHCWSGHRRESHDLQELSFVPPYGFACVWWGLSQEDDSGHNAPLFLPSQTSLHSPRSCNHKCCCKTVPNIQQRMSGGLASMAPSRDTNLIQYTAVLLFGLVSLGYIGRINADPLSLLSCILEALAPNTCLIRATEFAVSLAFLENCISI